MSTARGAPMSPLLPTRPSNAGSAPPGPSGEADDHGVAQSAGGSCAFIETDVFRGHSASLFTPAERRKCSTEQEFRFCGHPRPQRTSGISRRKHSSVVGPLPRKATNAWKSQAQFVVAEKKSAGEEGHAQCAVRMTRIAVCYFSSFFGSIFLRALRSYFSPALTSSKSCSPSGFLAQS